MNDEFHTHLKKAGDEIALSEQERTRMCSVLSAYMEMKPARVERAGGPIRADSIAAYAQAWGSAWLLAPRRFATALVVVLFVTSSGISYAAQGALPGDALYAVKVRVNEPVLGALALSSSQKAEWAMRVAGERLKEAATLSAAGRLTATAQADLQANFNEHATQAIAQIDEEAQISPETGAQGALRFEAQLSEYGRVLSEVGTGDSLTDTLAVAIQTKLNAVSGVRARAEVETSATSSSTKAIAASRMRETARHKLADSLKLARKVSSALATSSARVVAQSLEGASTSISDGSDLLGENAAPEALGVFQGALTVSEKLGVFLQTSSAIHKRTGRVITEPKKDTKSPSDQSRNDRQRKDGEEVKIGKTDDSKTATVSSPEDNTSVNALSVAANATTSAQNETDDTDTSSDSDTNVRWKNSDGHEASSPILIPAPSSLLR